MFLGYKYLEDYWSLPLNRLSYTYTAIDEIYITTENFENPFIINLFIGNSYLEYPVLNAIGEVVGNSRIAALFCT